MSAYSVFRCSIWHGITEPHRWTIAPVRVLLWPIVIGNSNQPVAKTTSRCRAFFSHCEKAECERTNVNVLCSFKISSFPGVLCHHLGAPWWLYTSTEGERREQCADKQIHTCACRHTHAFLTYPLNNDSFTNNLPITLFFPSLCPFLFLIQLCVLKLSYASFYPSVLYLQWLRLLRLVTVFPLSLSVRSSASQHNRIIEWIRPHGVQCSVKHRAKTLMLAHWSDWYSQITSQRCWIWLLIWAGCYRVTRHASLGHDMHGWIWIWTLRFPVASEILEYL